MKKCPRCNKLFSMHKIATAKSSYDEVVLDNNRRKSAYFRSKAVTYKCKHCGYEIEFEK